MFFLHSLFYTSSQDSLELIRNPIQEDKVFFNKTKDGSYILIEAKDESIIAKVIITAIIPMVVFLMASCLLQETIFLLALSKRYPIMAEKEFLMTTIFPSIVRLGTNTEMHIKMRNIKQSINKNLLLEYIDTKCFNILFIKFLRYPIA